ncbi:MAG: hypothetical protein IMZ52_09670 [Actinobacteria bacterium]|nr:hypothetical protein [Actinomycetota bacterium]
MNLFAQNLETFIAAESKILKENFPDKIWSDQKQFLRDWPRMEAYLSGSNAGKIGLKKRDPFVKIMRRLSDKGNSYLDAIRLLTPTQAQEGTGWLKDITEKITAGCVNNLHASRQEDK